MEGYFDSLTFDSQNRHEIKDTDYELPSKNARKDKPTNTESPSDKERSYNELKTINRINEQQRIQQVRNAIQARVNKIEEFAKKQEEASRDEWLKEQEKFVRDMEEKEGSITQAMLEYDKNSLQEHAKQEELQKKLAERRRMQQEELQAKQKQKKLLYSYIEKIQLYQQEFRLLYQQIQPFLPILKDHIDQQELKQYFSFLNSQREQLDVIVNKCKSGQVVEDDVKRCSEINVQTRNLKTKIVEAVENIKNKKQEQAKPAPVQPTPTTSSQPQVAPAIVQEPEKVESVAHVLNEYISRSNIKMFAEIMEFYEHHTASFKHLEEDPALKQFRFDCKKAVNIPVNSLSGVNSEHILDKYNKLYNLLKGQDVMVSDKKVNASQHPQGIAFCMNLLAKKFILQGDLMVAGNPESAFCYATMILSLWNDFPDFGKLILAHFYKSCPYLVPYYIPREQGESDDDYYLKQGYQYVDGQIEKQDKFLRRMTGIMRLYASILISKPKRGQAKSPYTLKEGWRWIASLLNLEPRLDITATMLHAFLETAGFQMEAVYGKMFRKLIQKVVIEKFMPILRKNCTGGAVTRLELLLTEYKKSGTFETPNGYVAHSYW
ncbi:unnamed protein product [Callosobruchus maculatus]|uniref:mRNA export factor GLE1 n=1 Tax=Callosobruchus maculatus TaxID=64391 RepID=A0A653BEW4_CALMS|nr:unnamed protein product [Callosobruchus maculatus]